MCNGLSSVGDIFVEQVESLAYVTPVASCVPRASEESFSLLPVRGQVTQGLEESLPTTPHFSSFTEKNIEFQTSGTAVLAEGITVNFGHGKQSLFIFK